MGLTYVDTDETGVDAVLSQTAAVGVEATMTDWATFRAGVNWNYRLSGEDKTGSNVGDDWAYGWSTGLGFNWGGFTADFTVDSAILRDPVTYMTGDDGNNDLTASNITLTYSF